ncbi:hypothetical protein MMC14_005603 [Varicellaria rhodocarpa]|nr:hypothetical protein [Varicellaria rhodocarpa]
MSQVSSQIKDRTVIEFSPVTVKHTQSHGGDPTESMNNHVSGLQALIPKVNALWKRAEQEEEALAKVRKDFKTTEDKLSKETAAHKTTKDKLDEADKIIKAARRAAEESKQQSKKERDEFQKEKAILAEEIAKLQGSLADVKKDRDSKKADLENTTAQLKKIATDLKEAKETSAGFEKNLKTAKETRVELQQELEKTQDQLDEANKSEKQQRDEAGKADAARDVAGKELAKANAMIRELRDREESSQPQADLSKLKADLSRLEAELKERAETLNTYLPPADKRNQRVYIHKVIYGGVVLENPEVLQRIQKVADSQSKFTVNNTNCGGDPWRGTTKTFVVSYMTGGKGPMKYYCAQEGNTVEFP